MSQQQTMVPHQAARVAQSPAAPAQSSAYQYQQQKVCHLIFYQTLWSNPAELLRQSCKLIVVSKLAGSTFSPAAAAVPAGSNAYAAAGTVLPTAAATCQHGSWSGAAWDAA